MNREKIFAGCPEGDAWQALEEAGKKAWALAIVDRALADFTEDGREPDPWEAQGLLYAVASGAFGSYSLVLTALRRATTAPEHRVQDHWTEVPPATIAGLRELRNRSLLAH